MMIRMTCVQRKVCLHAAADPWRALSQTAEFLARGMTRIMGLALVLGLLVLGAGQAHANHIDVTPGSLPDGFVGDAYSETLTASGGSAPYTFTVAQGSLPPGLSLSTGGTISGTPTTGGTFNFVLSVEETDGDTEEFPYSITIDQDTAGGRDVIVTEIPRQARRFARAQTSNIFSRLNAARMGDCRSFAPAIIVEPSKLPSKLPAAGGMYGEVDISEDARYCDDQPWQIWADGSLGMGERGRVGNMPSVDFNTAGLTAGIDYRFAPGAFAGVAVGLGRDSADIGSDGTTSKGTSLSVAGYGTFAPTEKTFIEAIAGIGLLDFDTHRFSNIANAFADANRGGVQGFGALGAGYRHTAETGWNFEMLGRLEGSISTVRQGSETGAGAQNITYARETFTGVDGVLGAVARYPINTQYGLLTPKGLIEYRYAFYNSFDQTYWYRNAPGDRFEIEGDQGPRHTLGFGLGFDLQVTDDVVVGLDYRGAVGSQGFFENGIHARLNVRF